MVIIIEINERNKNNLIIYDRLERIYSMNRIRVVTVVKRNPEEHVQFVRIEFICCLCVMIT